MTNFFRKIQQHFFDNEFLPFLFLGLLAITNLILTLLLNASAIIFVSLSVFIFILWLILSLITLNLIDVKSRLILEKGQINAIILSIDDPVITYTKDFEIILVNSALEKLVGISKKEIIGKIITPELVNNDRYGFLARIMFPSLAPLVLEKSTDAYPQKIKVKFNNPERTLEIITSKVIDENNHDYGFVKIIHDLTKEETLQKIQKDFITVAAHQLRTPLAGLSWIFEMMLKKELGSLTKEQEQLLLQGQLAIQSSLKTVEDLLNAAQIEEGRFGFQFTRTDIIPLIEEALTKFEPSAKQRNIKLIFHRPDFKLDSFVFDPIRIKLVLEILIDNAIKYNVQNGEVHVSLSMDNAKPFINISIQDTGIGIEKKDLDRLFTKFFRSEKVIKEETSGTGLGLYLAKNIVERHGGRIWVKSEVGRGSIFTFSLPLDPIYIPPQ
ncbi:MAG: sensor histidine kinase [Minisyncoccia bacterium]